jgi:photosystem II stability/assembly factor-like uncharacterized protein
MWGEDSLHAEPNFALSSRAALSLDRHQKTLLNVDVKKSSANTTATDATGWWGQIHKTTDGGITWSTVFESDASDTYYFNSISCSSETHCVAVTEGEDYVTDCKAFVTFDGGATWTDTLAGTVPADSVSLMGAAWSSETEGWLAGTAKDGRTLSGIFYKTVDGGKSYAVEQVCLFFHVFVGGDVPHFVSLHYRL